MRLVRIGSWLALFVQLVVTTQPQIGDKMRTLKAMCAAAVLALSLSIPAYADTTPGDGHGPGMPTPVGTLPPTTPVKDSSVNNASPFDDEVSWATLADILWALASIF